MFTQVRRCNSTNDEWQRAADRIMQAICHACENRKKERDMRQYPWSELKYFKREKQFYMTHCYFYNKRRHRTQLGNRLILNCAVDCGTTIELLKCIQSFLQVFDGNDFNTGFRFPRRIGIGNYRFFKSVFGGFTQTLLTTGNRADFS